MSSTIKLYEHNQKTYDAHKADRYTTVYGYMD